MGSYHRLAGRVGYLERLPYRGAQAVHGLSLGESTWGRFCAGSGPRSPCAAANLGFLHCSYTQADCTGAIRDNARESGPAASAVPQDSQMSYQR